jgi:hypothetical protein
MPAPPVHRERPHILRDRPLRAAEKLRRREVGGNAAVLDQHDAVGEVHRLIQIVRHQQNRLRIALIP